MTQDNPQATQPPHPTAVQNLAEAHSLLKRLSHRLDKHPELEQAIEKLELALNELSLKTGGML